MHDSRERLERGPAERPELAMFLMRFDLRGSREVAMRDLYAAALDMAAWAETRGCISVVLSEHHMVEDGYLPSPLVLAGAMAARTTVAPITVAALILPLYEPVRLAEEMAVLDHLSGGRMLFVAALGYRPEEYAMHGVDFRRRGKIADEKLALLLRAKSGEPFEHEGRRIHVTPAPLTPGGPVVAWGGGSVAAARRAGRNGIGLFAQRGDPALRDAYEMSARGAGHEPGMCILPSADDPTTLFVAHDVDRAWDELGPHLMQDVRSYASWNEGNTDTASISFAASADELRRESRSHRILSVPEAIDFVRAGRILPLHPLVGGLAPDVAWRYLRIVTDEVLPGAQRGS